MKNIFTLLSFLFIMHGAFAHGDVHERIRLLTQRIKENPEDVNLYLQRGQLYLRHENNENEAIADFEKALAIDNETSLAYLLESQAYLKLGNSPKALELVNTYLDLQSSNDEAYRTRAQIYITDKKYELAARDYDQAMKCRQHVYALQYMESADAWSMAGRSDLAIDRLKQGIDNMGFIITLYDRLVSEYYKTKEYQKALELIEIVLERIPNSETWMMKKGETEELLGEKEQALESYYKVLDLIEAMRPARRSTPAIKELQSKAKQSILSLR